MTSQFLPETDVSYHTAPTTHNPSFWTSEKVQSQWLQQEDFRLKMKILWLQILPLLPEDKDIKSEHSQNASSSHLLPNIENAKEMQRSTGFAQGQLLDIATKLGTTCFWLGFHLAFMLGTLGLRPILNLHPKYLMESIQLSMDKGKHHSHESLHQTSFLSCAPSLKASSPNIT